MVSSHSRRFVADELADGAAMSKRAKPARGLHKLTAREVLHAEQGDHFDGGGLLLRVRAAGSASWVLRYTSHSGARRELGLGGAPRSSLKHAGQALSDARDAAQEARALLRRGLDPKDERDRAKAEARERERSRQTGRDRETWTLLRCARDYHERVIEPSRTTKHAAQWISSIENHLPPALLRRPIGAIEPGELLAALLGAKPHARARNLKSRRIGETVRRIRQRLDAVWADAILHGRAGVNAAAAIRRQMTEAATPAERKGKREGHRGLNPAQAVDFVQALRAAGGTAARCLEFVILTASRTGEALGARWDEIDIGSRTWLVPADRMKADEAHRVYLSDEALGLVLAQRGQDPVYVFPSPTAVGRESRPLSGEAMRRVLDRLGWRDRTTVHGFRRTFSTWANETGAARPDAIEACLAHAETDRVRAAYNHAEFAAERRALLAAWARHLTPPAAPRVRLVAGGRAPGVGSTTEAAEAAEAPA